MTRAKSMQNMKLFWQIAIILLLYPIGSLQVSTPSSPSYIGAVVEYSPVRYAKEGDVNDLNVDNYLKFVRKAHEYSVDILVFPEFSLLVQSQFGQYGREAASYIPDPKYDVVPCDDKYDTYAKTLRSMSCAARTYNMYIAINHREKVACSESGCPSDGFLVYNTNVVFDRTGRVVARYRKYKLFGERGTDTTAEPELSTFKTDFGVTFGQFICFDILFESPALTLTRDLGVTDIIYPSHWFSELPHLVGVEAHAAWAYANDVNLLSSGLNFPRTASGGSGIYIGREGYNQVVSEEKASNVLVVSEIPKVVDGKRAKIVNPEKSVVYKFTTAEMDTTDRVGPGKWFYMTDNLAPYTTELITMDKINPYGSHNEVLYNKIVCDRKFCCEFKLKLTFDKSVIQNDSKYYRYRLAIFNGVRSFSGVATGGVRTCGIISCIDDTLNGCGKSFDIDSEVVTPTTFQSIDISTIHSTNTNDEKVFFMPITFTTNMMPFQPSDFSFSINDDENMPSHKMSLTKARSDLLTFAIYGRNFGTDGSAATKASR